MDFTYLNLEQLFLFVYQVLSGKRNSGITFADAQREFILFWDTVTGVSTVISLLLLTGVIYSYIRLTQVRKEEQGRLDTLSEASVSSEVVERHRDERWDQVLEHVNSESPSNWRQAIIEADTILEDIVFRAGYPGETLGEKMRGIEKSDFQTLDEAWEAHKVRNKIAHEGSRFGLTKREAIRVIDLYRKVFEEFYYI
ncbi:MAG: hypothetical protein WD153_02980 [Candidatus Paceibacterota bacterium]